MRHPKKRRIHPRRPVAGCRHNGKAIEDFDLVVAADDLERATSALEQAGFRAERFARLINFPGHSAVSIQLSMEDFYRDHPARAGAADVHGILLRVASLEETLKGKIKAWSGPERRQSKRIKDLADIARLIDAHPELWRALPSELTGWIQRPDE